MEGGWKTGNAYYAKYGPDAAGAGGDVEADDPATDTEEQEGRDVDDDDEW